MFQIAVDLIFQLNIKTIKTQKNKYFVNSTRRLK
jgi:hypothetical protein